MGFTQPGTPGTNGTFDTSFQNAWSAGTYTVGETVTNDGFLWVCTAASTTQEPTGSPSDWSKLANSFTTLAEDPGSGFPFFTPYLRGIPGTTIIKGRNAANTPDGGAGRIAIRGGDGAEGGSYTYGAQVAMYGGDGANAGSPYPQGPGGTAIVQGGEGGDGLVDYGGAGGGYAYLNGGRGGVAQWAGASGNGGVAQVKAGRGGANTTSGGTSGSGGVARVLGGQSGAAFGGATQGAGGDANVDAGTGNPNGNVSIGNTNAVNVNIGRSGQKVGFLGATAVVRQTVSGARNNPEAALANLLTALANLGLITNSTTAS